MFADVWQQGLGAALVQLAAGEFAAAVCRTSASPFRAVGRWLIDVTPIPLVDAGIALLRRADKPTIAVFLLLLWLWPPTVAAQFGRAPLILALAALGVVGLVALWRRVELSRAAVIGISATAIAAGQGAAWIAPPITIAVVALLAIATTIWRAARRRYDRGLQPALPVPARPFPPPAAGTAFDIPGISPLFTATERFYVTDVTFPSPIVNRRRWRLQVGGMIDRDLMLSYDELLAITPTEVDAVLMCVHNPVGGPFVGNARWQGVRLLELLDRAGVSPHADHIRLHSVDGFTAGFQLRLLQDGYDPLLAYGMNGTPLTRAHGAPLPLLVPGIHGYDSNIKWLRAIEVTQFDKAVDYAERKGWPRDPSRVGPQCRIDVPAPFSSLSPGEQVVAGVAWSPPHGLVQVEFRLDGGVWQQGDLASARGPAAWRPWRAYWRAVPGHHQIEARAWGRDGVQSETIAAPFPHGAGGHHRIDVLVEDGLPNARQFGRSLAGELRDRVDLALLGVKAWRRNRPGAR